jgi:hypothetical protein
LTLDSASYVFGEVELLLLIFWPMILFIVCITIGLITGFEDLIWLGIAGVGNVLWAWAVFRWASTPDKKKVPA